MRLFLLSHAQDAKLFDSVTRAAASVLQAASYTFLLVRAFGARWHAPTSPCTVTEITMGQGAVPRHTPSTRGAAERCIRRYPTNVPP